MKIITFSMGFTLIELLITIVIISVLAAIAYPSYLHFVVYSNRTEAQRELLRIANLQEQYYIDRRNYTEDMKKLGLANDPFITDNGYYSVDAKLIDGGFVLEAKALEYQKNNDSECPFLSVDEKGHKLPVGSCWKQ